MKNMTTRRDGTTSMDGSKQGEPSVDGTPAPIDGKTGETSPALTYQASDADSQPASQTASRSGSQPASQPNPQPDADTPTPPSPPRTPAPAAPVTPSNAGAQAAVSSVPAAPAASAASAALPASGAAPAPSVALGAPRLAGTPVRKRLTRDSVSTIALAVVAAFVVIMLIATAVTTQRRRAEIARFENEQRALAQDYGYNPGLIITDDEMFDSVSMAEEDIQIFLDVHGVACGGSHCISRATFGTRDEASDDLCSGYKAGSDESAAHIISGVATSCGINPKVLIVMLEKEQGLITAVEPTKTNYTIAMGLSCPDNGSCDTKYYGFFNQVYGAAHRLKYYQAHFSQYNYQPGRVNYIQYNPDTSCGGNDVYIENDATAMLYIYTPYQPNEAALEGLKNARGGTGDSCSTYGNRNFVLFYNAWFEDPTEGQGSTDGSSTDSDATASSDASEDPEPTSTASSK